MELVIFTQPSIMAKPGKGALHNPALGQHLKARRLLAFTHDIHHPPIVTMHPVDKFAGINAIRPHAPDAGQHPARHLPEDLAGAIPILDVRRMNHDRPDEAEGLDQQVPFSPLYALARIVAARPPFCVVFTDWLSRINALGGQFRPACWRTRFRKAACTCSPVPSCCHWQKYVYTVCHGTPKSCGIARQRHPSRTRYRSALSTSRRSTSRGRPPAFASGNNGSRMPHSASVRSLGYGLRVIPRHHAHSGVY